MMNVEITAPLKALKEYNQFTLWRLEDRGQPKLSKVPFDPQTGRSADPHDPAQWMTADAAQRLATLHDCGLAFVLTQDDPFFCVDLDNCAAPGGWNEYAMSMIAYFPGCAVEISHSGKGLHIFGKMTLMPPAHRVKTASQPGLEIYTRKRFIALGHSAIGDASTDGTVQIQTLVAGLGAAKRDVSAQWTAAPVPEYTGPPDDMALVRKMLSAGTRNAAAAFDGKATLNDLWSATVEPLARSYPSVSDNPFDGSSADMALCNHLAFWTGKDCERIDRLYRMSGLMRDKWERQDYRQDTVLDACSRTTNVYTKEQTAKIDPADVTAVDPTKPAEMFQYRADMQFLMLEQQRTHFEGCIYVQDLHKVLTPNGSKLAPEQFRAMYGGYEFQIDNNGKLTKDAWETFTQSRCALFPKVQSTCFRPELVPGTCVTEEGLTMVNTYVPAQVKMKLGDVTPFLDHVAKIIPDARDREIVLSYMAACVQYPGAKFQWCPVVQGVEGNGKSLLVRVLTAAVGERYTHSPDASDIANKFNLWLQNKLLIICDEIHFKGNQDIQDALKKFVTDDRICIQGKGADQITGDNRANWFFTTNHRDAVVKQRDGRRYSIFFTAQQTKSDMIRDGMTGRYFPSLYGWLKGAGGYAMVSHFLKTYPIQDEYNPATSCHVAPDTTSLDEAVRESLGRAEQEILEAVDAGISGFTGGWISSTKVIEMLDEKRIRMNRNKVIHMLDSLGYVQHPALSGGRAPNYVFQEGQKVRPILYCHVNSALMHLPQSEIMTSYMTAQGYAPT